MEAPAAALSPAQRRPAPQTQLVPIPVSQETQTLLSPCRALGLPPCGTAVSSFPSLPGPFPYDSFSSYFLLSCHPHGRSWASFPALLTSTSCAFVPWPWEQLPGPQLSWVGLSRRGAERPLQVQLGAEEPSVLPAVRSAVALPAATTVSQSLCRSYPAGLTVPAPSVTPSPGDAGRQNGTHVSGTHYGQLSPAICRPTLPKELAPKLS